MLEKALTGHRRYWIWISVLVAFVLIGLGFYLHQLRVGLSATSMGRDVVWGFYIAQFTFLVGVAASAVMVVLPYYLHNAKAFGKLTVMGEFLAIASVIMCMLFIFVDMGRPDRVMNVILHPTFHSMMFWDMMSLSGYFLLNVLISRMAFGAERKGLKTPSWVKPFIILSIPWAVSIHTVTAFLYCGLAGRPFWLSAILAPRFLASAFAAGPALLILIVMIAKKLTGWDPGRDALKKLAVIVAYAMAVNVFFLLLEVFTSLYSAMPEHVAHLTFLYFGLPGNHLMVPFMWFSSVVSVVALVILLTPRFRNRTGLLAVACAAVFFGIWAEKGLGMVIAGFVPSPFGQVPHYAPTITELGIGLGIYSLGALVLTVLVKVAVTSRLREPDPSWVEKKEQVPALASGD